MNNEKEIKEILETKGIFVSTTTGASMYPMLRDRKDTIIVRACEGRLKKYDVALYRSKGKYILHRVIRVEDDCYIMRGDNCDFKEYGIKDEQVLGVLTGFYRGEKEINMNGIGYRLYVNLYCRVYAFQWIWRRIRGVLGKIRRLVRKEDKNV